MVTVPCPTVPHPQNPLPGPPKHSRAQIRPRPSQQSSQWVLGFHKLCLQHQIQISGSGRTHDVWRMVDQYSQFREMASLNLVVIFHRSLRLWHQRRISGSGRTHDVWRMVDKYSHFRKIASFNLVVIFSSFLERKSKKLRTSLHRGRGKNHIPVVSAEKALAANWFPLTLPALFAGAIPQRSRVKPNNACSTVSTRGRAFLLVEDVRKTGPIIAPCQIISSLN